VFRRIVEHRIGWRSQGKMPRNYNKPNSVWFQGNFLTDGTRYQRSIDATIQAGFHGPVCEQTVGQSASHRPS
jgi:hypothetical protein